MYLNMVHSALCLGGFMSIAVFGTIGSHLIFICQSWDVDSTITMTRQFQPFYRVYQKSHEAWITSFQKASSLDNSEKWWFSWCWRMLVPASPLERQKDRETKGLQLSGMVARPRLGIRSQQKLGAEWNECHYFDPLTPRCLVRCVVRTPPCLHRLFFVHIHCSYFEPDHLLSLDRDITDKSSVKILQAISKHTLMSLRTFNLWRQIVPYNLTKWAKRAWLGFQIPHGVRRGRIRWIDKYCCPASLSRKKIGHAIWFNPKQKMEYARIQTWQCSIFSPEAYDYNYWRYHTIWQASPSSFFSGLDIQTMYTWDNKSARKAPQPALKVIGRNMCAWMLWALLMLIWHHRC